MTESLVLRDEQHGDEAFLRALYASTRADELANVGLSVEQADGFLRMQFDLQRMHYRRYYPNASFLIIVLDGRPVGRLYVSYARDDVRIIDIALTPNARGKGIGRRLLENVLAEADRRGAPVTLYVSVGSPAQRLYERLGFRAVSEDAMNVFMERPAGLTPRAAD